MLLLTRKLGESINIGSGIKVTVIEIKGKQVQLGIEAPDNIRIYREEIFKRIQEENEKAANQKAMEPLKIVRVLNKKSK